MNIKLLRFGRSQRTSARTVFTPIPHSFQTSRTRDYDTGQPAAVVEAIATEAGNAGLHDPDIVGENTHPHALDLLTKGHDVAAEVIGHGARKGSQDLVDVIRANEPLVATTEGTALSAIDAAGSAGKKLIALRHRLLSAGLPVPTRKASWIFFGSLVLLFAGDWSLNATGFQEFGLSDHPWIPGVGFSDDLHLASLTAVAALVFLADGAGHKLRRIARDLDVRRVTPKERRADVPWPAAFDIAVLVACVAAAFYALQGLSVIRADYLRSQSAPAYTAPFMAIQVGVLLAATYLSYWHANPLAKQWNSQVAEATKARVSEEAAVGEHDRIVGVFNADIDRLDTVFALAGHHVRADSPNVEAQHARYKHRYLLAQSEPAQAKAFTDDIIQPAVYTNAELYQKLIGVTPVPTFQKANTDKVIARKEKVREEIRQLLARIDNTEISKLNLVEGDDNGSNESTNVPPVTSIKPDTESPIGAGTDDDVAEDDERPDDEAAA